MRQLKKVLLLTIISILTLMLVMCSYQSFEDSPENNNSTLLTNSTRATLFSDDFEDGNYYGWSRNSGSWSVINDDTYVMRQASTSSTCYAYTGNTSLKKLY